MNVDLNKLKGLYESLKTRAAIEVGVFSDKNGRKDEFSNATLAAIHEYGSPKHNLPARSVLKIPLKNHASDIMASIKGLAHAMLTRVESMKIYKTIGIACEKVIIQAFDTGGFGAWAPLRYSTILAKLTGSLKKRRKNLIKTYTGEHGQAILVDTGQLRRAYASRVRMHF